MNEDDRPTSDRLTFLANSDDWGAEKKAMATELLELRHALARASSPDPAPLTPNRLDLAGRIYGLQEACVIAGQTSIGMAIYERIKFIEANTGEPRPDPASANDQLKTTAEQITDRLFANGAQRLVLELPNKKLDGGWCKSAVRDQILEVLEARPDPAREALVGAWISAKERLPAERQIVIVRGGIAYQDGGVWFTITGEQYPGRIIQWPVEWWMPLPATPALAEQGHKGA